jgi:hypothetical protein
MGVLWTELNYLLLSCAILCEILEIADVETPNNRASSANDIPDSLTNRSAVSERTHGILPRRLPIRGSSSAIFPF